MMPYAWSEIVWGCCSETYPGKAFQRPWEPQGEQLGLPRLAQLFAAVPDVSPVAVIRTLQEALDAFGDASGPHDDATLLCAHF